MEIHSFTVLVIISNNQWCHLVLFAVEGGGGGKQYGLQRIGSRRGKYDFFFTWN